MKERQNCGSVSEWLDDYSWPDEQFVKLDLMVHVKKQPPDLATQFFSKVGVAFKT